MHVLPFAAAVFGASSSASSCSPPSPTGGDIFALKASYNPIPYMNLTNTYERLYQKYRVATPPAQQQRRGSRAAAAAAGPLSGDAAAHPSPLTHGEYLCAVDIGTPPQRFRLNLDTGSSDLWVYGAGIPGGLLRGQRQYDARRSSTAALVPLELWLAGYIDFSFVGGVVYTDVVAVGGAGAGEGRCTAGGEGARQQQQQQQQLVVERQGVQVAYLAAESIIEDAGMDGILGLAFDKLNFALPVKQKTWFSNIRDKLSEPLFTVNFRHKKEGQYTFGYINKETLAGPVTYTPVDPSTGYWSWTSTGYAIGGAAFERRALTGTLDTGTPINMLPSDVVKEYYAAVPGAAYSAAEQGYVFDCSTALPDFAFGVEDGTITIPGAYINASAAATASNKCVGALQSGLGNLVVFGAPALKAGLAVFDAGSMRIGWANKTL